MKITKGRTPAARRIMLYGQHGVGKSTWAAQAPSPIFLNIEDGLNDIDCSKTDHLKTYGEVVGAVSWLVTNGDEFKTIVLDTIDWLELLIFRDVASDAGKTKIEEIGYGKGYKFAVDKWQFLLRGLDVLRSKGKTIVLLAHAAINKFESPEVEKYDRYEPDLHDLASKLIQEWCDEVLFASFRVFTRQEDQGFGKTRALAVGGKERYIRTNESAAAIAKNRLRLPDELPMDWSELAKHFPADAAPPNGKGNISGVVVEGSSKKKELVTNG